MKNLIYPVLLGLGLAGCSQSAHEERSEPAQKVVTSAATSAPDLPREAVGQHGQNMIYEGQLELAVDDFEKASIGIDHLLTEHGAYLSTAHESRANGQHRQDMTFKVPPAAFLPFVTALGKIGRIENKDISSADVTADMLEAVASLQAKQTTEAKYHQLLAATINPAEIRRLEEQARQSRLDVAAAQAQLQQFGARSNWATLSLQYFQLLPTPVPSAPLPDFGPRFQEAFYFGWSFLLGVLVLLIHIWPVFLFGSLGTWLAYRWRLRHPTQV